MANVVIALTSSLRLTKWVVPADCNSIQIEIIGAGANQDFGSGQFGGGGAYTKLTGFAVTPGALLTYSLGNEANDAWISNTGVTPTNTSQGALARSAVGASGGSAAACIPSAGAFSGGNAGFTPGFDLDAYGGGGGAAGPNGNGANGGDAFGPSPGAGGGGGGANGGSAGAGASSTSVGGAGGNGRGGTGGGTAGSGSAGGNATAGTGGGGGGGSSGFSGGAGAQDNVWTDYAGNVYGPGGGAGGSGAGGGSSAGGVGYGGGGTGSNGLIIITYTPVAITGGPYTEVFTIPYGSNAAVAWRTPLGVTSVQVEAIGGGGIALDTISGRGGGGGAYAKTTSLAVTPGDIAYVRPAYTPTYDTAVYATPIDSWFNKNANTAPGNTSAGVLAAGSASGLGGTAANCIGVDLKYSGGNGGLNNTTASGAKFRGGGGGGSAGPSGAGKDGGNGWNTGTGSGTGGGGGGSNGGSSSAGSNAASATVGGAGGNGTGGTGGGAGGTATTNAVNGTANTGGGGGGGSASATSFRYDGAPGAASTLWTIAGNTYGPAGGSGGAGCTSTTTGQPGYHDLDANYGAGVGSGTFPPGSSTRGFVIITYSAIAQLTARLFSTGTLAIANTMQFDEIAQNTASIQSTVVYSSLFDEVSQTAVAMRILSNGSIQVSNIFDEVTGIA